MSVSAPPRPASVHAPARSRILLPSVLVGAVALAIGAIGITGPALWTDEAATISSATRSWPQLFAELGTIDAVHGLYYALMHLWFDLVGANAFTLRLPSAVAIALAAALLVPLGAMLRSPRYGVLAGIVLAIIPRATWAAVEGRSSAATAFVAVLATLLLVVAMRSTRRRAWVAYGVVGALGCVLFVYLALVLAAHLVAVVALAVRGQERPGLVRRWVLTAAVAAVVVIPFALFATRQHGQVSWLPGNSPRTIGSIALGQWFMDSLVFALPAAVVLVAAFVLVLRRRELRPIAAIALPILVLPTLALVVLTPIVGPLYNPRYLTMCLPVLAMLLAIPLDALPARRIPWLTAAAVLVLAAVSAPSWLAARQPSAKDGSDWQAVAGWIAADRAAAGSAATAFLYGPVQGHDETTARILAEAYPAAFANATDPTLGDAAAPSGRLWSTSVPLASRLGALATTQRIYLVTTSAGDGLAATEATLAPLGFRTTVTSTIATVEVIRFER